MSLKAEIQAEKDPVKRNAILTLFRKILADENAMYTKKFVEIKIPKDVADIPSAPKRAFRNRDFLVQFYRDDGFTRLSINRTALDDNGDWVAGITWDEIWSIKCGLGRDHLPRTDLEAWVEVHPPKEDLTNVANIRHLTVLFPPFPPWVWRKP